MNTLSYAQIACFAKNAGFSGGDLTIAVAITVPESHRDADNVQKGQPHALTGWGLWQITPGDASLLNPQANANAAYAKYKAAKARGKSGFSPWTTYVAGLHVPYMPAAGAGIMAMGNCTAGTPGGPGQAAGSPPGGSQGDLQGIGAAISGAAGAFVNRFVVSGTGVLGLLVIIGGLGLLGYVMLDKTKVGRGIGDAVKAGVMMIPK